MDDTKKSNVTATVTYTVFPISRFLAFGTRFGSLESEKIIIGSPKSEKIGSLQIQNEFLIFSFKKNTIRQFYTEKMFVLVRMDILRLS